MNSAATSPIFAVEGKSLAATELRSGDLEITGYAAVFQGLDAAGENFLSTAFTHSAAAAVAAGIPICYHHQTGRVLGKVLDLRPDAHGLWLRGRIDKPTPGSFAAGVFEQIKRHTLRGLSVAGYLQRIKTAAGAMISNVRLTEISVTGVPSHPLTGLDAVEVKALGLDALEDAWMVEASRQLDLAAVRLSAAEVHFTARGL